MKPRIWNQHYILLNNNVVYDLGIEIDSSLKYDVHINKIIGKA